MPSLNSSLSSNLRLMCDEQLGRLAKGLRRQGYDTLFECPIEETDYEKQSIHPIPKAQIESRVPQAVFNQYDDFYTCLTCKKIFWRGTHVKNSQARLRCLTQ